MSYALGNDGFRLHLVGLAPRAERERRLLREARQPRFARRPSHRKVFLFPVTIATDIHADLITPLGAYLRLRAGSEGSFLLESVEKGRLGRYSLVGSGLRLVSFDEAEDELAAGRPVVGYLGYDHVALLEPTRSSCSGEGAGAAREPLRRRGDARALRPRRQRGRGPRGRRATRSRAAHPRRRGTASR